MQQFARFGTWETLFQLVLVLTRSRYSRSRESPSDVRRFDSWLAVCMCYYSMLQTESACPRWRWLATLPIFFFSSSTDVIDEGTS